MNNPNCQCGHELSLHCKEDVYNTWSGRKTNKGSKLLRTKDCCGLIGCQCKEFRENTVPTGDSK